LVPSRPDSAKEGGKKAIKEWIEIDGEDGVGGDEMVW